MIENPGVASIPIEDDWIDAAGEELEGYHNQPFLPPFMENWGLNPNGNRPLTQKIDEIKQYIRDPEHVLRLDDLAAYLDDLKPNGKQFIFLWRLKPGNKRYLARLAETPESNKLVWETDEPVLAEVRRTGVLRFKWVFTRRYHVAVPPGVAGAPPVFAPRTQRAVTFFCVNLETGDAELRIQSLPEGVGLPSHREEFELYRALVEAVVELNRFSPVAIEPVASHWLRQPPDGLVPTTWRVARPSGELVSGGGKNADRLANSLDLFLGRYFVRKATFRWDCPQCVVGNPLYFTLDGLGDSVDFNGRADAPRVDFLLGLIRQGKQPSFQMRVLRTLAKKHPEYGRILSAIDRWFLKKKEEPRISTGNIAADVWYDRETIERVFALIAKEFPQTFVLEEDVLILRNRFQPSQGGLVGAAERSAKERGHSIASQMVKPAAWTITPLILYLFNIFASWLGSHIEEAMGGWVVWMKVSLVLLLWVLYFCVVFGSPAVKGFALRLWRPVYPVISWVFAILSGAAVQDALERMYQARRPAPIP